MTNFLELLERVRQNYGILPEEQFHELCNKVTEIMIEECTVVSVHSPVVLCGDIHGQFFDLLTLFEKGGPVSETKYIFMGDYVDRGAFSIETLTYLLLLKACYPTQITLLRGNHESRNITRMYGFYDEVAQKYGSAIPWTWCMDMFDYFPVAAVIDGKYFCVHGGLSPDLRTIDQIRAVVKRDQEIPHSGPFCDLMWSDPEEIDGLQLSPRGAGYLFGETPVKNFCEINNLEMICRSHQLVQEGIKFMFHKKLVTVWSAPNYCYRCGNIASILCFNSDGKYEYKKFEEEISETAQKEKAPKLATPSYFL